MRIRLVISLQIYTTFSIGELLLSVIECNVNKVCDVRQIELHTVGQLVANPSPFEVAICFSTCFRIRH
jgi:hypothetical protein